MQSFLSLQKSQQLLRHGQQQQPLPPQQPPPPAAAAAALQPIPPTGKSLHGRSSSSTSSSSGSGNNASSSAAAAAGSAQIIRLRGLPFSATEADVQVFLAPIELPDGLSSVHLARHPDLRPTGEAYVALRTESELLAALKKHKSSMGKRYIEVRLLSCVICYLPSEKRNS
jgi:hypothetical protein